MCRKFCDHENSSSKIIGCQSDRAFCLKVHWETRVEVCVKLGVRLLESSCSRCCVHTGKGQYHWRMLPVRWEVTPCTVVSRYRPSGGTLRWRQRVPPKDRHLSTKTLPYITQKTVAVKTRESHFQLSNFYSNSHQVLSNYGSHSRRVPERIFQETVSSPSVWKRTSNYESVTLIQNCHVT